MFQCKTKQISENIYPRFRVGLVVEVFEEEEEHDGVHADPPDEGAGVVAVDEQQLERVHHYTYELHLEK